MGVECTLHIYPWAGQRFCTNQLQLNPDKKLFKLLHETKMFGKCDGSYLKYYTDDGWKFFSDGILVYKNQDIVEQMRIWVENQGGDNHHNEAIYQYLRHIQCGTPVIMRWH